MSVESIYSIHNGKYYITSRDEYILSIANVPGKILIVGIPPQNYNGSASIFTINADPKLQYGTVRVENYYLTYDPKNDTKLVLTKELTDLKTQTFCFSRDGRILLPLFNPDKVVSLINVKSSIQEDPSLTKGIWKFSNYSPPYQNRPSLWNSNITYNMPLNNLETYFNQGAGDSYGGCDRYGCSCHTSRGASCGSDQTFLARDAGVFEDKVWCLKTKWDEKNKPSCCSGDTNVLKVENKLVTNKLDYDKCKIVHGTNICGRYFGDEDINKEAKSSTQRVGAWAPFSSDCKDSSDTINFCAQQDTLRNQPLLLGNKNCQDWCRLNPSECQKAKSTYCENNPQNGACVTWCNTSEIAGGIQGGTCKEVLRNFCVGKTLENESVCERFCNNKEGNCDPEIRRYCSSLGDEEAVKHPICGCFMSVAYNKNFFDKLKQKLGPSGDLLPILPDCFYPECALAPIKTNDYYKQSVKCPDINQCINHVEISAGGDIKGDIHINQENTCGFKLRPQDCGINDRIDEKLNKCVPCGPGLLPTPNKLTCVCPNPFVLDTDQKTCVCPAGKIKVDNTCIDREPDDFTLQLTDYIKKSMPINNEIDKEKVIINSLDMATSVLTNGCGQSLEIAKECSNFIPEICSIKGSIDYCKNFSDDSEFCNANKTPKNITTVYGFSCDKIRKPVKPDCSSDEYYDPFDNICHTCPNGMKLKKDKSGCEPIECKDNEYLDINTCVSCPFGTKVRSDKKGCEDIECEDDQYLDTKGNCVYCPPGSKVRMDGKGCEPYFVNCLPDQYLDKNDNTCKICPDGYRLKPDRSGCDKITKECKSNEYLDIKDNTCKTCPNGYKINSDRSGCEKITSECKDNEYIDLDTFECHACGEGEIVSPDKHSCVRVESIERQLREYLKSLEINYKNIDQKAVKIHLEEIVQHVLNNGECNTNVNEAKNCINNLLKSCDANGDQILFGFDCNKITIKEEPKKNSNILLIIGGIVLLLIVLGLVFKKKK
jgi:hypothetical protein